MAWWRRRRPIRRYQPPSEFVAPPLEDLVEEGLMIALAGVRMSVKNRILVHTLRDGVDLDLDWCEQAVGAELAALAQESADDARRLAGQLVGKRHEVWVDDGEARYEPERLPRRQRLLTMMAARLHQLATDEEQVRGIAIASRDAALDDMVAARALPLQRMRPVRGDARDAALALLREDLEELDDFD